MVAVYGAYVIEWSTTGPAPRVLPPEAVQLAEILSALVPDDPEAHGLAALVHLSTARAPARLDGAGRLVPLAEQDPQLWDADLIDRAHEHLRAAHGRTRSRSPTTPPSATTSSRSGPPWMHDGTGDLPSAESSGPGSSATVRQLPVCPAAARFLSGPRAGSDLETSVLQVELPLDPVHHLVADQALVAEPDDRAALSLEQFTDQALVGQRSVLRTVVLEHACAGLEPPPSGLVHALQALDRVVAGRLRRGELLKPLQGRIGRGQTRS